MRGSFATVVALALFAAILCAPASAPASPLAYPGEAAAEAPNRIAAEVDAGELLALLALPPGSTFSGTQPPGSSKALSQPFQLPGTPKLVDRTAWWTVPGSPATVLAALQASPPAGSHLSGEGSSAVLNMGEASHSYMFSWPSVPGVLSSRDLLVTAAAEQSGNTALRVDAQVVWIVPRPASEQIPSRARILEVAYSGELPRRKFTVVKQRTVRRIAALIDGLPIVQPIDPHGCPGTVANPRTVVLTFRADPGGRALAVATQDVPAGPCSAMGLAIRGTPQPLLARGAPVLRALSRLRPAGGST